MKKAHRNTHKMIWLVLFPIILAGLTIAILSRQTVPLNETLPIQTNDKG